MFEAVLDVGERDVGGRILEPVEVDTRLLERSGAAR
jgi:hypothetical protein